MTYYEYPVLFEKFFEGLGIEVVCSRDTNRQILENGIKYSVDEACLASKIYLGHVYDLIERANEEKIDCIFIPRICSFKNNETVCVKFYAMYDICSSIFDFNFVTLNIDAKKKKSELSSFLELGKSLGFGTVKTFKAYREAKMYEEEYKKKEVALERKRISKNLDGLNILVVSHPYVYEDSFLGKPILKYLSSLGASIFYSNINEASFNRKLEKNYKKYTKSLYWKYSKNLLNGIDEYLSNIDGIIYLSSFPCGPDSLVTELAIRKIDSVPSINILLDDQDGSAGLYTRLESFYDILEARKNAKEEVKVG